MSNCRKNNWTDKSESMINDQINLELTAQHTYTALSAYFASDQHNWPGLAKFMKESANEEREHAEIFINYQNTRGGTVKIGTISPLDFDFTNTSESILTQALGFVLQMEQKVYESILAISEQSTDPALSDFLDDFLKEQLEAQYQLGCQLSQLKTIGMDGYGLWHFDKNLSN